MFVCLRRDIAAGDAEESDSVMCCGHDPTSHITSVDFQPDGPLLVRLVYSFLHGFSHLGICPYVKKFFVVVVLWFLTEPSFSLA